MVNIIGMLIHMTKKLPNRAGQVYSTMIKEVPGQYLAEYQARQLWVEYPGRAVLERITR